MGALVREKRPAISKDDAAYQHNTLKVRRQKLLDIVNQLAIAKIELFFSFHWLRSFSTSVEFNV